MQALDGRGQRVLLVVDRHDEVDLEVDSCAPRQRRGRRMLAERQPPRELAGERGGVRLGRAVARHSRVRRRQRDADTGGLDAELGREGGGRRRELGCGLGGRGARDGAAESGHGARLRADRGAAQGTG